MTDMSSLDLYGPLEGFREVGRSLPGTEIAIIKSSPQEDDGIILTIQVRFAIEAETPSWDTTKILKKHPKPLTKTASFTQETTASSQKTAFCSSLVGPNS